MKKIVLFLFSVCFVFAEPNKHYLLSPEPIDVVIPCHPKDAGILSSCIRGIRANGNHIRNIFVISKEKMTEEAIWINETSFPFQKQDLIEEFSNLKQEGKRFSLSRMGWMYQQLLKLYAAFTIPGISSNVLVLDADTVFLQRTSFITDSGEPLFAWGKEYYPPYFKHAKRLLPSFERAFSSRSGICHHMLFQRPILEDLMQQIEREHNCETWRAFCRSADPSLLEGAPFSEYEIYFHFVFSSTTQAHLRELKWKNVSSLKKQKKYRKKEFDFLTCHNYS